MYALDSVYASVCAEISLQVLLKVISANFLRDKLSVQLKSFYLQTYKLPEHL